MANSLLFLVGAVVVAVVVVPQNAAVQSLGSGRQNILLRVDGLLGFASMIAIVHFFAVCCLHCQLWSTDRKIA